MKSNIFIIPLLGISKSGKTTLLKALKTVKVNQNCLKIKTVIDEEADEPDLFLGDLSYMSEMHPEFSSSILHIRMARIIRLIKEAAERSDDYTIIVTEGSGFGLLNIQLKALYISGYLSQVNLQLSCSLHEAMGELPMAACLLLDTTPAQVLIRRYASDNDPDAVYRNDRNCSILEAEYKELHCFTNKLKQAGVAVEPFPADLALDQAKLFLKRTLDNIIMHINSFYAARLPFFESDTVILPKPSSPNKLYYQNILGYRVLLVPDIKSSKFATKLYYGSISIPGAFKDYRDFSHIYTVEDVYETPSVNLDNVLSSNLDQDTDIPAEEKISDVTEHLKEENVEDNDEEEDHSRSEQGSDSEDNEPVSSYDAMKATIKGASLDDPTPSASAAMMSNLNQQLKASIVSQNSSSNIFNDDIERDDDDDDEKIKEIANNLNKAINGQTSTPIKPQKSKRQKVLSSIPSADRYESGSSSSGSDSSSSSSSSSSSGSETESSVLSSSKNLSILSQVSQPVKPKNVKIEPVKPAKPSASTALVPVSTAKQEKKEEVALQQQRLNLFNQAKLKSSKNSAPAALPATPSADTPATNTRSRSRSNMPPDNGNKRSRSRSPSKSSKKKKSSKSRSRSRSNSRKKKSHKHKSKSRSKSKHKKDKKKKHTKRSSSSPPKVKRSDSALSDEIKSFNATIGDKNKDIAPSAKKPQKREDWVTKK